MSWASEGSKVFRAFLADTLVASSGTSWTGLDSDSIKVALFNNTTAPDRNAANTAYGYNTGQWVTGNEVTDSTNWVAGGRVLAGKSIDQSVASTVFFDATDLAGAGVVTLTNAYGCLVYDDTVSGATPVAKPGVCFNYFGGAQSVTAGTFTIVWNANGIWRATL